MCIYMYMYSTWQMPIYIYVVDTSYFVQHIQEGQKAGLRMNTCIHAALSGGGGGSALVFIKLHL